MNNKKAYIINVFVMLVLIGAAFYIILKGQDINEIIRLVRNAKFSFLFLAIVMVFVNFMLQSLSTYITLREFGGKLSYLKNLRLTFVGYFFNAITPSAGGGQPMQVFYMRGDNISIGMSSVTLLFWTTMFKTSLLVIQVGFLIFFRDFIFRTLGGNTWLYFLGIIVNLLGIAISVIVIFWTNGVKWLTGVATWLLKKFKLVKKEKKFKESLEKHLDTYAECSKYVGKNYLLTAKVLVITVIQRIAYFSITWFSLIALNVNTIDIVHTIILQSLIAVCIDIIPVPGGAGVNEGFYVTIFNKFISKKNAISSMLISRGITFYLMVLVGAVCSLSAQMNYTKMMAKRKPQGKDGKTDGKPDRNPM
ncbi:MAG: flippase-like domain-containing protein [Lachnospiraceae bacterium]|nr:flippase-like domain-containing protein [Lachnospiraceae bacterium]